MKLDARVLAELDGLAHGFFGRAGGVSTGIYAGLNCGPGSGDDPSHVAENRRRASAALGVEAGHLLTLYQVHSPDVVMVREPFTRENAPKADAMVTDRPGIALGVLAADCAPVLFADAAARVIGAAHAGWKGAIAGVTDATLAAMEALGAKRERVVAVVGPCISQEAYEVGAEFRDTFLKSESSAARFFAPGVAADKFQFDLPGYVAARLSRAGVASAGALNRCTYFREPDYFSFRRTTHRREGDYGRNLSAIVLRP